MVLSRTELLQLAEDARTRVAGVTRGLARAKALAPAQPTGAANRYAAAMSRYSGQVRRQVEKHVLSKLPVVGSGDPLNVQALEQGLFELRRALDAMVPAYGRNGIAAARATALTARLEVERMMNVSFRNIPGRAEGEAAFLVAFGHRQVQLLENINAAQVERIRLAILQYTEGDSMRQDILDALWVSRNRAQMVAHNEVHALNTDIIAYWAQQAGSEEFVWVTSHDERVRHGHAVLDGTVHRWDSPPNTGRKEGNNLPGHPPGCRCRAVPKEALEA
jgi:SPP1 gp7 family putative phage head morphogenesis protein